jgi:hypothetical protein
MTSESRLDGNAAGGVLGEIFPFEMTTARTWCARCGARGMAGEQPVYDADGPGVVMRCLQCESVLIRVAHAGGSYCLDMRGLICLEMEG